MEGRVKARDRRHARQAAATAETASSAAGWCSGASGVSGAQCLDRRVVEADGAGEPRTSVYDLCPIASGEPMSRTTS